MDEETIIQKRLFSKETVLLPWQPSLSKCTSAFLAFADAAKNKSAEECDIAHNNLVKQLRFYEFEVNKAQITKETCAQELKQYDELDTEIERSIRTTAADIERLKRQLGHEKIVRQHKEEYETLASVINQYPTRAVTQGEINAMEEDIAGLTSAARATGEKVELRNKQFQLLLHSLHDLQRTLEEEEEEEAQGNEMEMEAGEVGEGEEDEEAEEEAVVGGREDDAEEDEEEEEREVRGAVKAMERPGGDGSGPTTTSGSPSMEQE